MNDAHNRKWMPLVAAAALAVMLACNAPLQSGPTGTSFDDAHLMMITARNILGEYTEAVVPASRSERFAPAAWRGGPQPQSTLEQLNQQLALAKEYQRLAAITRGAGNDALADIFLQKAETCLDRALELEVKREEWRRNRRFNTVIRRSVRNLGQAIGNTLDFVGTQAGMYVDAEIEGYIANIKTFLHNPLRYAFDVKMGNQLEIIQRQFTDRLGPFFGQRVYELIGIDQAAWGVEGEIFEKPTARVTPTAGPKEGEADFSELAGTYQGTTDMSETWNENWNGTPRENEILVKIERDGRVTGSVVSRWDSFPGEIIEWEEYSQGPLHYCEAEFSIDLEGTIDGQLTDTTGMVTITYTMMTEFRRVDCPEGNETLSGSSTVSAEIRIEGNTITGSAPGLFNFEAVKE